MSVSLVKSSDTPRVHAYIYAVDTRSGVRYAVGTYTPRTPNTRAAEHPTFGTYAAAYAAAAAAARPAGDFDTLPSAEREYAAAADRKLMSAHAAATHAANRAAAAARYDRAAPVGTYVAARAAAYRADAIAAAYDALRTARGCRIDGTRDNAAAYISRAARYRAAAAAGRPIRTPNRDPWAAADRAAAYDRAAADHDGGECWSDVG